MRQGLKFATGRTARDACGCFPNVGYDPDYPEHFTLDGRVYVADRDELVRGLVTVVYRVSSHTLEFGEGHAVKTPKLLRAIARKWHEYQDRGPITRRVSLESQERASTE